ncbi:MAG: LysM peptidoglycan-binding domain-containing protein [Oscillospiraceae bacterium]|jgi:nucleoid-associated protein YgaU|nr:LysM peptidoglycan-binding domain-containing protein [Oscillospiraceae bacterium]
MDIHLTCLESGQRMRFPMLPESISLQTGAQLQSHNIMAVGDVKLPSGNDLSTVSWDGKLPGRARRRQPYVRLWQDPRLLTALLHHWQSDGRRLRLLVTQTPINLDVYIESFGGDFAGGYGDFDYNIAFTQARQLRIHLSGQGEQTGARPCPPASSTHTVRVGETLWAIAQRHLGNGAQHQRIYNANRDIIEAEAQRRKGRSSNNGHWIFPGTVLQIPR